MKSGRVQAAPSVSPSVCLPPLCLISLHYYGHISLVQSGHDVVISSSPHQGMNFWSLISSSVHIIVVHWIWYYSTQSCVFHLSHAINVMLALTEADPVLMNLLHGTPLV